MFQHWLRDWLRSNGKTCGRGHPPKRSIHHYQPRLEGLEDRTVPSFITALDFGTGANPFAVAVGDLNRDGKQDLFVVNRGSNTLSVLLAKGVGSFQPKVDYATPSFPVSLATGDFDRDGNQDITVSSLGILNVFLGNGDGTLQPRAEYDVRSVPQIGMAVVSVTVGDFNGDGHPDLAALNPGEGNVAVLLGKGDGAFPAMAQHYATGSNPSALVKGDFDSDGKQDLAVANNGSNSLSVLLGNGNGTFQARVDTATGSNPNALAVGDYDRDGRTDLAVANYGSKTVRVLLGNDDGTFRARADLAAGSDPNATTTGDFDGDGQADLAVTNYSSRTVNVFLSNGNGTFQAKADFGINQNPVSVAVGDFDSDGRADLAVANFGANTVSVLLGKGDGSFRARTELATGSLPYPVEFSDFDNDGKKDLVIANYSSNTVSLFRGKGNGTFQAGIDFATGSGPLSLAVEDFNNDGSQDLAVANLGTVSVLLSNGDGTFLSRVDYATGSNSPNFPTPDRIAVGDFNGDGRQDLAVVNDTGYTLSVFLGKGDGSFQPKVDYATGSLPVSIAVGDLNNDGRIDLVVANLLDSPLSLFLGKGDGTFQARVDYSSGGAPYAVAVDDFNGDGRQDLAVASRGLDAIAVHLGNGDATFQPRVDYSTGSDSFPRSLIAADFDKDGRSDFIVAKYNSNTVSLLLGRGDGTFAAGLDYAVGGNPFAVAAGDVNGDGRLDIAVTNSGNSSGSVFLGNNLPVAADDKYLTVPNKTLTVAPRGVLANDSDKDGDSLRTLLKSNPKNGTLVLNADGSFTYTPAANFIGLDSFAYQANDLFDDSNLTTVTLSVDPANNRPPAARAAGPYTVAEGGTLVLDASASSDPDGDPLTYQWDVNGDEIFGDVDGVQPTLDWSRLMTLGIMDGPSTFNVKVRLDDGQGHAVISSAVILSVTNVNPMATIDGTPANSPEGTAITLTGSVSDPGSADSHTFAWSVSKNGAAFATGSGSGFSFTPDDNGTYMVSLTVTDDDGGSGSGSAIVSVANVAPANLTLFVNPSTINQNGTTTLSGSFTDSGPLDTHTAIITWGDGASSAAPISEGASTGTVHGSHMYTATGTYTIAVTVTDKDGAATTAILQVAVVAVPDPNGVIAGAAPFGGLPVSFFGSIGSDAPLPGTSTRVQVGPQDIDMFQVIAPDSGVIIVDTDTTAYPANDRVDTFVRAFDERGNLLGANNDRDNDVRDSHVEIPVRRGQTIYIGVSDVANQNYNPFELNGGSSQGKGGSFDLRLALRPLPPGPPAIPSSARFFVTGADAGGGPDVKVYDAGTGAVIHSFFAFNASFTGGVRVAVSDVTGDGVPDIIGAAGPGGGPNVRVFDGRDGQQLPSLLGDFYPYDRNFTGGVFVAAGDVNGDGLTDIITAADAGGGPDVKVIDGRSANVLYSFFTYDPRFGGGIRVAAADVDGDGLADVITGAGAGGGPDVKYYRGFDGRFLNSFFAFDMSFTGGVFVSAADIDGDSKAEILVGKGPGAAPDAAVFRAADALRLFVLTPYDARFTGGVRVTGIDRNRDGRADILTVAGPGGGADVKVFDGTSLTQIDQFFPYDAAFTGGIFVAASVR